MVGAVNAQVDVTLEVDMNSQTVDDMLGVHVAGNFGATNPAYTEWNPGNADDPIVLTDDDMDGVYSVTLQLVPGTYQFKYVNGNDWPMAEDVPNACRYNPAGDANRYLTVGEEAMTYRVCFSECADCGMEAVRFRVDMTQYTDPISPVGVHVAGTFQLPDPFIPGQNPMEDYDDDGIWDLLYAYNPADYDEVPTSFNYKYIVGNQWVNPNENAITADCGTMDGGDRVVELTSPATITPAYCYNSCNLCVAASNVTFRVDMSNVDSPDGAYIAGAFQGWNDSGTPMEDPDMDEVYEIVIPLQPGDYQYKFLNGPGGWEEGIPGDCSSAGNRIVTVEEGVDQTVEFCFLQCDAVCVPDPDPEDITFRVNTNDIVVSADGVYLITAVTTPAWQAGATQMSDPDDDGVYEATLNISGGANIEYKFTNGDPFPGGVEDLTVEENHDFDTDGCGVATPLGGFNRTYVRDGMGAVLDVVCYNSCVDCDTNVDEIEARIGFTAYPNPAQDVLKVTFDDITTVESIQLMNQLGQELKFVNGNDVNAANSMDISYLSSGVYTLRVNTSQGAVTKLIIKK